MSKPNGIIRRSRFILLTALLLLAPACSTLRVQTDYARTADFASYRTYSWMKVSADNSLWEDRIRRAVNAQLAEKGWKEAPSGGQASVAAFRSTRVQPTLETFYHSFGPDFGGWYWGWGGWGPGFYDGYATTQVINIPIGTLVVDIFNSNTKRLIWRGVAEEELSDKPEKNIDKLSNAVAKMFEKFPPPTLG